MGRGAGRPGGLRKLYLSFTLDPAFEPGLAMDLAKATAITLALVYITLTSATPFKVGPQ